MELDVVMKAISTGHVGSSYRPFLQLAVPWCRYL